MNAPARIATVSEAWFAKLPDELDRAVSTYDLPSKADWQPLADLSAATEFEGIEVFGEHAVISDGSFVAPADVYVTLVYEPNTADRVEFPDSYPARVFFQVATERVTIDRIEVDTRSFYG